MHNRIILILGLFVSIVGLYICVSPSDTNERQNNNNAKNNSKIPLYISNKDTLIMIVNCSCK